MPDCGPLTRKGNKAVDEFALATGYNMKFTEGFEGHLVSVGFTDVRIQEFPIPVGEWPEDERKFLSLLLEKMHAYMFCIFTCSPIAARFLGQICVQRHSQDGKTKIGSFP